MLNQINKRRGGFTLVEIMIVVAIIALLAAIAVPGFLRARKRSQASRILNDLRLIDAAVDQYAIENNKTSGSTVNTHRLDELPEEGLHALHDGRGSFRQRLWRPERRCPAKVSERCLEHPVGRGGIGVLVSLRPQLRI